MKFTVYVAENERNFRKTVTRNLDSKRVIQFQLLNKMTELAFLYNMYVHNQMEKIRLMLERV